MSLASRLAALASLLLLLSACQPPPTVTPPGPTDAGSAGKADGGGSASIQGTGQSCLQIFSCMFDCASGDEPCLEACYEAGSEQGKSTLLTFAKCVEDEQCNDADCIQSRCGAQLSACVGESKPQSTGTPLQGSAPPGSVPADLAGAWVGARNGITQRLTLNADGTGSWETSIATKHYACLSSVSTVKTGSMLVAEKTITVYATSVVEYFRECVPPVQVTNYPPQTEVLLWSRANNDPNTILLIDAACAAQYPGWETCEYAGCPVGLYCTGRLTRE